MACSDGVIFLDDQWVCDRCTLLNKLEDEQCQACNNKRPEEPEEPYDNLDALTRFPRKAPKEIKAEYYAHYLFIASETNNFKLNPDVIQVITQFCESSIFVGSRLDVRDKVNKWYVAEVLKIELKQFFVHYVGWSSKWDEWVSFSEDERYADLYTHTKAPDDEKNKEELPTIGVPLLGQLSSHETNIANGIRRLESMGYNESEITPALVESNGDVTRAMDILQRRQTPSGNVNRLMEMGFKGSESVRALDATGGNFETALQVLCEDARE